MTDLKAAWLSLSTDLATAAERVDALGAGLDDNERADGFRVLSHALGAQLEGLEMDRLRPVPVPHNTWQTKYLMDNPDGLYWVFEVTDGQVYELRGNMGDAAYGAITLYIAGEKWHDTRVAASIDDQQLLIDGDGNFVMILGGDAPASSAHVNWLALPQGARTIWLRQFYNDIRNDRHGWVESRNMTPSAPAIVEPELLAERLRLAGRKLKAMPNAVRDAMENELSRGNHIRTWSEMHDGAVFTSSDIWYQRGAWDLQAGEALVITGSVVAARYWNIVLYSRWLNSLEHRYRPVTLTGGGAKIEADGSLRMIISSRDPGLGNWLDNEGREQGMFALRWVCPESEPSLPTVQVVKLADLDPAPR